MYKYKQSNQLEERYKNNNSKKKYSRQLINLNLKLYDSIFSNIKEEIYKINQKINKISKEEFDQKTMLELSLLCYQLCARVLKQIRYKQ